MDERMRALLSLYGDRMSMKKNKRSRRNRMARWSRVLWGHADDTKSADRDIVKVLGMLSAMGVRIDP